MKKLIEQIKIINPRWKLLLTFGGYLLMWLIFDWTYEFVWPEDTKKSTWQMLYKAMFKAIAFTLVFDFANIKKAFTKND